jgi:hypothetical protein
VPAAACKAVPSANNTECNVHCIYKPVRSMHVFSFCLQQRQFRPAANVRAQCRISTKIPGCKAGSLASRSLDEETTCTNAL